MKTVPSNRTAKVLDQITSVKCYSLCNHFSGEKVEPALFLSYLERMAGCNPRVRFDKLTGHGQVKFHSNEWYEFLTA